MYLTSLNGTLKYGQDGKFYVYFATIWKGRQLASCIIFVHLIYALYWVLTFLPPCPFKADFYPLSSPEKKLNPFFPF